MSLRGLGWSSPVQLRRPRSIVTLVVTGIRSSAASCWINVLRSAAIAVEVVVTDGDRAGGRQQARRGGESEPPRLARLAIGVAEAADCLLDGLLAEALRQPGGDLVETAV